MSITFEAFTRSLEERQGEVRRAIDEVLGANDVDRNKKAAVLFERVKALQSILANTDVPPWLSTIFGASENFIKSGWSTEKFVKALARTYAEAQQPLVLNEDSKALDFDELFDRLREENGIPVLLEQLANSIEKIVNSGEVESVTILAWLNKLLNVVKQNRNGSYISIRSVTFLAMYVKRFVSESLKAIPVLGVPVNAFEKAVEDLKDQNDKIDTKMREAVINSIAESQLNMKRLEEIRPLTITVAPHPVLPGPSTSELRNQ